VTWPAVFFDRDGTLIRDAGYPRDPSEVELLPGVVAALQSLRRGGFKLVVVSNQSGIGRGIVTVEEASRVDERFHALLSQGGIRLDEAYYCPHDPSAGCDCRKPAPGMLRRAATELEIDLSQSWMIGDKPTDIEAGQRAGCRTLLVTPAAGEPWWAAAVETILQSMEERSSCALKPCAS